MDFIGWYTNKTETILKISKEDALDNTLHIMRVGGIINIIKNKKVIGLAKKVERQSNVYKNQLLKCKRSLTKTSILFFN